MKRLTNILILLFLCIAAAAQNDGPYIIYGDDGTRVVTVDADGGVHDELCSGVAPGSVFTVTSHDGRYSFDVTLHKSVRPEWKRAAASRTLVISDPHGNLDCFISVLQGNGVIDGDLHWSFGDGSLLILGDISDRGNDATQIYWLVYQLEAEAEKAGGRLSFLYGNHEGMVLAGDLRYTKAKYKELADTLGTTFPELMGPSTELGRWLATRNTIQIEGDNLFVHAGLSGDFLDKHLTIPEVNEMVSKGLFYTSAQRKEESDLMYFLYRTYGPIWYRGLVYSKKKYVPASPATLDAILAEYGVSRIFVGHTIFPNVKSFYRKKVVAVNVDNQRNHDKNLSRGVLLEDGSAFQIGDNGVIKKLK